MKKRKPPLIQALPTWLWIALGGFYLFLTQISTAGKPITIRHRGFEDFSRGSFPDGGANIYVSRSGRVQLIPRWDLNRDGYLDLIFSQDHDVVEKPDALIYWGSSSGYESLLPPFWKELPVFKLLKEIQERRRSVQSLPSEGGGPVRIADLNRDGHPEIIFTNVVHNYSVHTKLLIYWGSPQGYSSRQRTELPTLFGLDLAVADFNRDGWLDLAVANFGEETGSQRGYRDHLESYLYWGSPEGFSVAGRTSLATVGAVSCASGDFNADGWIDLAFANSNPNRESVFVYLGGDRGFLPQRLLERSGEAPDLVRAGDANGDAIDDLIIGFRDGGALIYPGSQSFRLDQPLVELPTRNARDAVMADLNQDGHPDLVFASSLSPNREEIAEAASRSAPHTLSEVYLGSPRGFHAREKILLPTLAPRAVDTGDLNGDGYPDIVFANFSGNDFQDIHTFDVPSYIYWGAPNGFSASNRSHLQSFGAVGVALSDLDRDGVVDVVLSNQKSGGAAKGPPSIIFWGNSSHNYSEANHTRLPTANANYTRIADLDDDGFPDLVFGGSAPDIYWGGPEGLDRRTRIPLDDAPGVTVGDFNRDGNLDLCFMVYLGNDQRNYCQILWGNGSDYSVDRSTVVPLKAYRTCCGVVSGDLDRDGYLDLVLPSGHTPEKISEVVWGGPNGFGKRPSTLLVTDANQGPTIADLDANGWLDLIFPGAYQRDTGDAHTESFIYWGSQDGYSDARRTGLEAYGAAEAAAADLDGDGHLDLAISNYKGNQTRSLPLFLYWGSETRSYSRRSELPAESSNGIQILDLNQDQRLDLIVHNHLKDGDHTFGSYIYWGRKGGFSTLHRTHLPTVGTHHAMAITPGSIYDRSPAHPYLSSPLDVPQAARRVTLVWTGETPRGTEIRFDLRFSPRWEDLTTAAWLSVEHGRPLPTSPGSRYVQYRALLISPDGGSSPVLSEVVISFE